jgi:hypothetical protein
MLARMSDQVNSMVGVASYPVAVTAMPRSVAAGLSMDAFRGPVEAISFRFGSCCRIS